MGWKGPEIESMGKVILKIYVAQAIILIEFGKPRMVYR